MARPLTVRRLYVMPLLLFILYLWEFSALLGLLGQLSGGELLFDPQALLRFSCRTAPPLLGACLLLGLLCALLLGKKVCVLSSEGVLRGDRAFPWEDIRSVRWESRTPPSRGVAGRVLKGDGGSALLGDKRRLTLPHLPLWAAFVIQRRARARLSLGGPWPLILFVSQLFALGVSVLFTCSF
ncbi:MAG: hypothetical protein PHD67_00165 [Oscillospiraceae bacterium]|nr:hypothetical protein [Oscillospiraceae bacterium]